MSARTIPVVVGCSNLVGADGVVTTVDTTGTVATVTAVRAYRSALIMVMMSDG
jgi:hypothetical protein